MAKKFWEIRQVLVWDTEGFNGLAWSPSGDGIAGAGTDGVLWVWDPIMGVTLCRMLGHSGEALSVAWSPDGKKLISGGHDHTVRIWDATTGKERLRMDGGRAVTSVAWSPRGNEVASGGYDGTVRIWDAATGKERRRLGGHGDWVRTLAWSPDGKELASGGYDCAVRTWDATTGLQRSRLQGHRRVVKGVAWSPNGKQLASGGDDGVVRIWDAVTSREQNKLEGHAAWGHSVAWSPNGKQLASGGDDGVVRIWDVTTGKERRRVEGFDPVTGVAWSPDGKVFGVQSGDRVAAWEMKRGSRERRFGRAPLPYVGRGICFLPKAAYKRRLAERILIKSWTWKRAGVVPKLRARQRPLVSAKIVLVGESNVGKSCLALRLAEDRYEERGTTHGMQIWRISAEGLKGRKSRLKAERQEAFLWDLGGQENYRLVHQLFLQDTTVAMLLCDPTRGQVAYEDVLDWNQRLEARLRGQLATKLLVRTKLDQPAGVVDPKEIARLRKECGIQEYLEVSARTATNIPQLRKALDSAIQWKELTRISRPALFQKVYDQVNAARNEGKALLYFQKTAEAFPEEKEDLEGVVRGLARQGLVVDLRLASGDRVLLLRVDAAERYAGALIVLAGTNPRGVPAIEERTIGSPDAVLPGMQEADRLSREAERAVLECVVQLLIESGICLRHEGLLIFPSLFKEAAAEAYEAPHRYPIYYDFTGPIDNIYASLVVKLALSGEFGAVRMWKGMAEFEDQERQVCGLRKADMGGGAAHLDLYFSESAPGDKQGLFALLVEEHLRKEGVRIVERLSLRCHCSFDFPHEMLRRRLGEGKKDVGCPDCDKRYPLTLAGTEETRRRSPEVVDRLVAIRESVERRMEHSAEQAKRVVARSAGVSTPQRPV